MDWEGILKAWTMKVVPNSARITVTRSDSIYSRTDVCARASAWAASVRCSATGATSVIRFLLLVLPRGAVRGPALPRIARLLSYCYPCRSRSRARGHPLASKMFSGDRARPHALPYNEAKAKLAPGEIPGARIYGRTIPAGFLGRP